jgi:spore photoproduct lyase
LLIQMTLMENPNNNLSNRGLLCWKRKGADELKVHCQEYEKLDGTNESMVSKVGDGSIITRFDKTPNPRSPTDVVCPHFLELKWATGCHYNCAWCYLQGTFRFQEYKKKARPKDFERIEKNLLSLFDGELKRPELLNSGELSDSLLTEHTDRPFTKFVMDLIDTQDTYKVLFVSKSNQIENLLEIKNPDKAVVSFSINASKVAKTWEKGAPTPLQRLDAAKKLKVAGFEVRLRIDPMVPVEGWKEGYEKLVDDIFKRLRPDRITIGSLRGLQSTINNSTDRTWTQYLDERSNWGKKISQGTRAAMYRTVIDRLESKYDFTSVAMCKETVEMWKELGMDYRKIKCNCTL